MPTIRVEVECNKKHCGRCPLVEYIMFDSGSITHAICNGHIDDEGGGTYLKRDKKRRLLRCQACLDAEVK